VKVVVGFTCTANLATWLDATFVFVGKRPIALSSLELLLLLLLLMRRLTEWLMAAMYNKAYKLLLGSCLNPGFT
jgi:hypothetical protein